MGENKKKWEKLILFFIGALSVSSAGLSSRLSSKCRLILIFNISVAAPEAVEGFKVENEEVCKEPRVIVTWKTLTVNARRGKIQNYTVTYWEENHVC